MGTFWNGGDGDSLKGFLATQRTPLISPLGTGVCCCDQAPTTRYRGAVATGVVAARPGEFPALYRMDKKNFVRLKERYEVKSWH